VPENKRAKLSISDQLIRLPFGVDAVEHAIEDSRQALDP
jgi:cystathionine beta-lyase/cystathionine gamma-synthase